MPANDYWSVRQVFGSMNEAAMWYYDYFLRSDERNIEDYDKALGIYERTTDTFGLEISFSKFIEIGQSLRARQALKNIQQDNDYGI